MNQTFARDLEYHIQAHPGWGALEQFGQRLGQSPLNKRQLRVFLASTAHFFREIPGGILALALRVTEDRMDADPFGAAGSAARILLSAVDE
jgi:hypothetical protein